MTIVIFSQFAISPSATRVALTKYSEDSPFLRFVIPEFLLDTWVQYETQWVQYETVQYETQWGQYKTELGQYERVMLTHLTPVWDSMSEEFTPVWECNAYFFNPRMRR